MALEPIDWKSRMRSNTKKAGASGAPIAETATSNSPARNIFLRPIISPIFPVTGWATALAK
ncbi:hypothetical protein BCO26_1336 [Heyndrickxia coagulans 2-6]|nr:hypothetical protein BCO26_1336 [Heyndrickxia coagulans 2-6]